MSPKKRCVDEVGNTVSLKIITLRRQPSVARSLSKRVINRASCSGLRDVYIRSPVAVAMKARTV